MDTTSRSYDVITMGRSSIDLYSNDIGAPFVNISSFAAYVGGCPTNISVDTRRLGVRSALLTAIGDDQVGNFIVHFLQREGVETRFIPRKPGYRSSAVLLGIEPPDRFPLTYYREKAADIELTIDDVLATPIAQSRVLLIAGTNLVDIYQTIGGDVLLQHTPVCQALPGDQSTAATSPLCTVGNT